jgi:hypothetical protein
MSVNFVIEYSISILLIKEKLKNIILNKYKTENK